MTADIFSNTLGLLFMGTGNDNNTWGSNANSAVFQIIEDAIAGALLSTVTGGTLDLSGSPPPAAASQARYAIMAFNGTLGSDQIVQVPNLTKIWLVNNACTLAGHGLTFKTPSGLASAAIPLGWCFVYCDGANAVSVGLSTSLRDVQWLGADGSTSAPGISFAADPTTGVSRPATGKVAVSVAAAAFGILLQSVAQAAASAVPHSGAAGTNFAIGDTITLAGGTSLIPTILQVASLTGSAIATVTVQQAGLYSTVPGNPVSAASTSGSGTGATFDVTWGNANSLSDLAGGTLWAALGASSYMATLMTTVSAAALYASLRGTTIKPTILSASQNDYAPTGIGTAATVQASSNSATGANVLTGLSSSGSIDGRDITLECVGSNPVPLSANSTSSSQANRFLFRSAQRTLWPGDSVALRWDSGALSGTAGWRPLDSVRQAMSPLARSGCICSNDVSAPTTVIDISAGAWRSQDDSMDLVLASAFTKSLASSWVAGTGNGMRSSAGLADGSWHVFLIGGQSVPTDIFAHNAADPTSVLPAGYTSYRRIFSMLRESSAIFTFYQRDNQIFRAVPTHDGVAATIDTTERLYTLSVPTGVIVDAQFSVFEVGGVNGIAMNFYSPSLSRPTPTNLSGPTFLGSFNGASSNQSAAATKALTNTAAQVRGRASDATTGQIWTTGWNDFFID